MFHQRINITFDSNYQGRSVLFDFIFQDKAPKKEPFLPIQFQIKKKAKFSLEKSVLVIHCSRLGRSTRPHSPISPSQDWTESSS